MKKNLMLLFLVGFASMIIQISLLVILLSYFTQSSIVTGLIIGSWIFGLGLGGIGSAAIIKKDKSKTFLISFQFILGVLALFLAKFVDNSYTYLNLLGGSAYYFAIAFTLLVGFLSGTAFLLINSFYKENKDVKTSILSCFENWGSATSSFITGILLIPFFGIAIALVISGILFLLVSFVFLKKNVLRALVIIVLILMMVFIFPLNKVIEVNTENITQIEGTLYKQNSPYGVVEVLQKKDWRALIINGVSQCVDHEIFVEGDEDAIAQVVNKGDNVLNIGLGCGIMHDKIKVLGANVLTVEINSKIPGVYPFFSKFGKIEKEEFVIEDGFKYMRTTDQIYDVIVLDPQEEYVPHSTNLYTAENFQNAHNILTENGTLFIRDLSYNTEYDCVLYNTIFSAFNYVYLIQEEHYKYIVGSDVLKELESFDFKQCETSEINTITKPVFKRYAIYNK